MYDMYDLAQQRLEALRNDATVRRIAVRAPRASGVRLALGHVLVRVGQRLETGPTRIAATQ
jgi:hypothetical protein